ncbi:MAG TPA: UDP-3-O-(3-hydroxymyristoyl)glucosamine N-acyltransferase [Acidobacteriota bacterium]|nr:UDP-3-O-(3-hydroxymyristoyl)glucosamine N-acyltransferase [Acidobacteriota bacterium]
MSLTFKQLAEFLEVEWTGTPELILERVSPFESAQPGSLCLALGKHREHLADSQGSAFIVDARSVTDADRARFSLLLSPSPKITFAQAIARLHARPAEPPVIAPDFMAGDHTVIGTGVVIHPRVTVGRYSSIGDRTVIHPGVVIGDRVTIGNDCVLFPNVTIYERVTIGDRAIIHAGTVIGSDGFGFAQDKVGRHIKIPQIGDVVIEDDVELGANCTIDRATLGTTRIRRGTKFDNMVHIAHNCDIGEDTVIAAQAGISGSVRVGNHVMIAGQVGTNPHVEIGDGAIIAGKSGVSKSVGPGEQASGMPILSLKQWKLMHIFAAQLPDRLPKLEKRLKVVEQTLEQMKNEE